MFINIHTHILHQIDLEILNLEHSNLTRSYFSTGIHPNQAHRSDLDFTYITDNSLQQNCLAIGECGLDKIISTPINVQTVVFKKQIKISEKKQLPLILHCVKSWNEVLQIKKELKPKQIWIFHGFRKITLLESVLENGLLVSIGAPLIYDLKLQAIFNSIPIDQLFLETDSDDRFSIEEVYAKAAELKGFTLAELKSHLFTNFKRVFTKFIPDEENNSI